MAYIVDSACTSVTGYRWPLTRRIMTPWTTLSTNRVADKPGQMMGPSAQINTIILLPTTDIVLKIRSVTWYNLTPSVIICRQCSISHTNYITRGPHCLGEPQKNFPSERLSQRKRVVSRFFKFFKFNFLIFKNWNITFFVGTYLSDKIFIIYI